MTIFRKYFAYEVIVLRVDAFVVLNKLISDDDTIYDTSFSSLEKERMIQASYILFICLLVAFLLLLTVYIYLQRQMERDFLKKLEEDDTKYLTKTELARCLDESREYMQVYL